MAPLALLTWPFIALVLVSQLPRMIGFICVVLIPYLLLPEAYLIPLPGLPDLDKTSIISLGLVLAFFLMRDRFLPEGSGTEPMWRSPVFRPFFAVCIITMIISLGMTIASNPEPLLYGPRFIPAMRLWDGLSLLSSLAAMLIPAMLALRYLSTPESHRVLLKLIVVSALAYSVLMFVEIRFSPQLHKWVYGYHQHSFLQHLRDGYRPMVFLKHGIHVGFFVFTALIAAVSLWRSGQGRKWGMAALWLMITLMMSRNLGALMLAFLTLGLLWFTSRRIQMISMLGVALLLLLYPAARQSQVVPLDRFLSFVEQISEGRAQSLEFRFDNEDILLSRAAEKPVNGWGMWGRNRIYDQYGNDISVTDGLWIQILGSFGWMYYLGFFALITFPIFCLRSASKIKELSVETQGLALILMANLIYLIPNSALTPLGWTIIGALTGWVVKEAATAPKEADVEAGTDRTIDTSRRKLPSYSRYPHAHSRRA